MSVRYAATLTANVLRTVLAFASGLVIAKTLGANDYGRLAFLLGSFAAVSSLFDAGTSSAFYTLLAARRSKPQLFVVYGLWLAAQFAIVVAAIGLLLPNGTVQSIWFSHDRTTIILAWGATFFSTQLWTAASQMGEAVRRTVRVQMAGTAQAVAHLAILFAAKSAGILTARLVFVLLVCEYLLVVAMLVPGLYRQNLDEAVGHAEDVRALFREFLIYCKPLIWYTWAGFVGMFADRWLLERYGGSVQQGYFSVAQQFSAISLLATAAILRVLWKELAEAKASGTLHLAEALYSRAIRMLFFVGVWVSFLVIPHSAFVIGVTLGPAYAGALIPFVIMLLYPIHQSLGQIQATFFYATGRTSAYARIGLAVAAVNLPMTYVALAPREMFGLGLGAVGLAIKMVLVQLGSVAAQAWSIKKSMGWSQDGLQQLLLLGLFAVVGCGSRLVIEPILSPLALPAIVPVAAAAGCYGLATLAILRWWPSLAGLDPAWVKSPVATLRRLVAGAPR